MFGVGFDDGHGAAGETDDVKLLENETYKFRWVQYQRGMGLETAFELVMNWSSKAKPPRPHYPEPGKIPAEP